MLCLLDSNFHASIFLFPRLVISRRVYVVRVNFFPFIVYYRVLLLFLFKARHWHCPLPVFFLQINVRRLRSVDGVKHLQASRDIQYDFSVDGIDTSVLFNHLTLLQVAPLRETFRGRTGSCT